MKIGVMFGNPETTTGGNALKFYSSVRMDIRRIGAIKANDAVVGNRTRVKVVKNKMAPPFREHEFDIMYGAGISRMGDVLDLATDLAIVDKAGAWYSYQGERLGQGREQSMEFLKKNLDKASEIEGRIRSHFKLPPAEATAAPKEPKAAVAAATDGASEEVATVAAAGARRRGRPGSANA